MHQKCWNGSGILRDRRDFLKEMGAFAALLVSPSWASENAVSWNPDHSPFGLGIASGSPTADGIVLWTRLVGYEMPASASIRVTWELFKLDGDNQAEPVMRGETVARPELGHSVHVELGGLDPGRWYGYHFRVGRWVSPLGRTRTLPRVDSMPARLKFAYASCQSWEVGLYTAYRHMKDEALDLVVFVGDYIYEGASSKNPAAVRLHNLRSVRNLSDYRARYALYKSDLLLQAVHAQCPWLVIWDDHEVQNNYAAGLSMYQVADFSKRRAAAYQAYYEHMPLRASTLIEGIEGMLRGAEMRIYDRVEFGRLAAFHVLDCRQYRGAPLCPPTPPERLTAVCTSPDEVSHLRSMLGAKQAHWLDESLQYAARKKTVWNLIVHQSRFTPGNYRFGVGHKMSVDTWDGYPEVREQLLESIARLRPRNPIFVAGDLHQNWVARVHQNPYDARSPALASEFVGTSISSTNGKTQEQAERHAARNPHCLLSNTEKRGYGVMELTSSSAQVALRVLDDVRDPFSKISTLARFVVDDGKPLRRA